MTFTGVFTYSFWSQFPTFHFTFLFCVDSWCHPRLIICLMFFMIVFLVFFLKHFRSFIWLFFFPPTLPGFFYLFYKWFPSAFPFQHFSMLLTFLLFHYHFAALWLFGCEVTPHYSIGLYSGRSWRLTHHFILSKLYWVLNFSKIINLKRTITLNTF